MVSLCFHWSAPTTLQLALEDGDVVRVPVEHGIGELALGLELGLLGQGFSPAAPRFPPMAAPLRYCRAPPQWLLASGGAPPRARTASWQQALTGPGLDGESVHNTATPTPRSTTPPRSVPAWLRPAGHWPRARTVPGVAWSL
eukprot:CAMPEP_0183340120 /NCGR_PEP_ID=MMETSP0164_2-20130417/6783_1 /TAXON_ID=221442 /ORGANISM="Coccolithus pelagicus ssp braarudi, Strain PLY182g" /LENGTH=141 /DNA_ID=CAMNT_0025510209 /DNA_START=165 /DNA_END=590 /DNA_ORIENTATION=-